MKKCVFAGTFDPPTIGHKRIIDDCLKIFDEVVVAVMINTDKKPLLTIQERTALLEKLYNGNSAVRVRSFSGAAVDLLNEEKTPFYVRGIRNTVDLEYENMNHFASSKLKSDIITIYLPSAQDNIHVSSTLVKNSVKFNKEFKEYIPSEILDDVIKMFKTKEM